MRVSRFAEGHRQRKRFFAAGAAGHPGAQLSPGRMRGEQMRQDLVAQHIPDRRVAEEAGDADQQFLEQQVDFLRVLAQVAHIVGDALELMDGHAPLDTAIEGVFLVEREIVPGTRPQQYADLVEPALLFHRLDDLRLQSGFGFVAKMAGFENALRQVARLGNDVDQAGINSAARHAVELGGGRVLHQHQSAAFLDGAQAMAAVRTHAGENDPDGVCAAVIRQRPEEEVDRQAQAARRYRVKQVEAVMQDGDVPVRRNDIDAIRLHLHPVLCLHHRHGGCPLQQFGQDAGVIRGEVLNHDISHAAADWHMQKKLFKRFQPASGRADGDDRKGLCGGEGAGFGAVNLIVLPRR